MTDKTVHATITVEGYGTTEVCRSKYSGSWRCYHTHETPRVIGGMTYGGWKTAVRTCQYAVDTVMEAIEHGQEVTVHFGQPGGKTFDQRVHDAMEARKKEQ